MFHPENSAQFRQLQQSDKCSIIVHFKRLKHKKCNKWWYWLQNYDNLNFPAFSLTLLKTIGYYKTVNFTSFFNKIVAVKQCSRQVNIKKTKIDENAKNEKFTRNPKKCGKIQIVTILKRISLFVGFFVLQDCDNLNFPAFFQIPV